MFLLVIDSSFQGIASCITLKAIQSSFPLCVHMEDGILQCYSFNQETMSFSEIGDDYVIWPGLFVTPLHSSLSMATGNSVLSGTCVFKSFYSPSF